MNGLPTPHWVLKDIIAGPADPRLEVRVETIAPTEATADPVTVNVAELHEPPPGACVRIGVETIAPRIPAFHILLDSIEPDEPQGALRGIQFVEDQADRFYFVNLPPWSFGFAASRKRRTLLLVQLPDDTKPPVRLLYANGDGQYQALGEFVQVDGRWSFQLADSEICRDIPLIDPPRPLQTFLVGGVPKSGTTWVEKILNAHPQILCLGQGEFFCQMPGAISATITSDRRNYFNWSLPDHKEKLEAEWYRVGRAMVAFQGYSRLWPGLAAIGDRSPNNSRGYELMHHQVRTCRMIHCIRHPLDVVVSRCYHEWNLFRDRRSDLSRLDATNMTKLDDRLKAGDGELRLELEDAELIETFLNEWVRFHELAFAFQARHPALIRMIHYEKLLHEPAHVIDGMFTFLLGQPMRNNVEREMILGLSSFEALSGGRSRGTSDDRSFFRKGTAEDYRGRFSPPLLDFARQKVGHLAAELGYAIEG